MDIYSSKEYKISRFGYWFGASFDYLLSLMVMDPFFTKLLLYIGLDDATVGVISSFSSFACLFSVLTVVCLHKIKSPKRTVVFCKVTRMMLCFGIYLVPFLDVGLKYKVLLVAICFILGHGASSFVSSIYYKWGSGFFDPLKRSKHETATSLTSLIFGIAFSLSVGMIFDKFDKANNILSGFIFLLIFMAIIDIFNIITAVMMKGTYQKEDVKKENFFETVKIAMTSKGSKSMLMFLVIRGVGTGISLGFFGTYKINELSLSVSQIQMVNIIGWVVTILTAFSFAKWADRQKNYTKAAELGTITTMICYSSAIFMMPETAWLVVVFQLLSEISSITIYQGPLYYDIVGPERLVESMAVNGIICNAVVFIAALFGAEILKAVQANENMIFGIRIYGQQLLALISTIILFIDHIYLKKVVQKQKIMRP